MRQLGAICSQLSTIRFDKIGSLFEDEDGQCDVRECLSPGFVWGGRPSLENISRGPFDNETEYYSALVSAFSQHIQLLPLEHHAFFALVPIRTEYSSFSAYRSATDLWNDFVTVGCKIDSSKNRLDYYIVSRALQEMIPSLTAKSGGDGNTYCLCHPDLSSSNIFVDDAYNITCIIDWGFSSVVPMNVLFMPPGLPHPRDELIPSLASEFRAGTLACFDRELGGLDPNVWETSRKLWLFTRTVNLECLQDYCLFSELYTLVYRAPSEGIAAFFEQRRTEEDVETMRALLAEDDEPAADIKKQEMEYFNAVGSDRYSMAKALTVMSNLNKHFVADSRLWRWLMEAVPPSTWSGGYST